jgi:hypothetical protein
MLMSRESSLDSIKASVSWILTDVTDKAEIGKLHMTLEFSNKNWSHMTLWSQKYTLNGILKKMGLIMFTKFFWLRICNVCRLCWKWHEPPDYVWWEQCIHYISGHLFLKRELTRGNFCLRQQNKDTMKLKSTFMISNSTLGSLSPKKPNKLWNTRHSARVIPLPCHDHFIRNSLLFTIHQSSYLSKLFFDQKFLLYTLPRSFKF